MLDRILFIIAFSVLAFLVGFAFLAPYANALNPFDITYPIPELGNCASQEECKVYCDQPENAIACLEWAAKVGMMPPEEVEKIKSEIEEELNKTGPGGCKSKEECDAFCAKPENAEVCLEFAVQEGTITKEEADFLLQTLKKEKEMREKKREEKRPGKPDIEPDKEKMLKLMEQEDFEGPGGCKTMDECRLYCEKPENAKECMEFALENGLIEPEVGKKMLEILEEGGPGGCKNPQECDEYCSQPEHMEECLEFAKEHDLIPPEEIEEVEKMMKMMEEGGPGGCKTQEECDAYCRQPEHMEECMDFSVKMGVMSEEEAERIKMIMKKMEEMKEEGEMMGPPGFGSGMFEGGFPPPDSFPGEGEFMPPPEGFPGEGGFPPPSEFPGAKGEFPGMGEFPPPSEFPGGGEFPEKDKFMPWDNFSPPMMPEGEFPWNPEEGFQMGPMMPPETPEEFGPPFGEEFIPPEGFISPEGKEFVPPEGFIPPEEKEFQPPEEFIPPPEGFVPPPEGEFVPPPEEEFVPPPEEPTGYLPSIIGTVLGPFLEIFR